jgi:phosphatidylinositol-3,4,5-trisphosphate 3-phosphatase/dual-specificity protein phosphatase PTEN
VICCWCLYSGVSPDVESALALFKSKRSQSDKGGGTVDEPSQVRYIEYFANIIKTGKIPEPNVLQLRKIILKNIPKHYKGGNMVVEIYMFKKNQDINSWEKDRVDIIHEFTDMKDYGTFYDLEFNSYAEIAGDVVIDFTINWTLSTESLFRFSFHTAYVTDSQLHAVHKDLDEGYKNEKYRSHHLTV